MSLFKKKKTQNYKNETQNYKEAQIIFFSHGGNHFHMWQDDVLAEYEKYKVPKTIENMWLNDIKEKIEAKVKVYKDLALKQEIVIDDYHKKLPYMKDYDFSPENIIKRINEI